MCVPQKNVGDLFAELETAPIVFVPVVHAVLGGTGQIAEISCFPGWSIRDKTQSV